MLTVLSDLGSSLHESFFMFWDTLWALLGGFALSGAVQAFAPRRLLRTKLGDHRPGAIARASAAGALSSSCSYAASAMAKSLFANGADFVTSMVFMFASTNLVIELGVVLVVLMGWQFAVAEYAGGIIMIGLLALLGGLFLTARLASKARPVPAQADENVGRKPGIRTRAGWTSAATYTVSDLTMLRRELLIGFLGAGMLAVLVPVSFWRVFFLSGHGALTSIENAVAGPFIAMISFVCSIGNVPLAAALWHDGISFGGVISFLFGDLVALPLVLIYRKYYGRRLALRMLAGFWALMAAAGLVTELAFSVAGLIPARAPASAPVAPEHLSWNYTTVLNLTFLVIFAVLYYLHRTRDRLRSDTGHAIDPVCGMQVERSAAPAQMRTESGTYWFCSEHCLDKFASLGSLQSRSRSPARA
ncbi:MAG TPA: permease [Streptosporangiaceae bacterium]|nr:permease [Streptosporangiaceae bacterium]